MLRRLIDAVAGVLILMSTSGDSVRMARVGGIVRAGQCHRGRLENPKSSDKGSREWQNRARAVTFVIDANTLTMTIALPSRAA